MDGGAWFSSNKTIAIFYLIFSSKNSQQLSDQDIYNSLKDGLLRLFVAPLPRTYYQFIASPFPFYIRESLRSIWLGVQKDGESSCSMSY